MDHRQPIPDCEAGRIQRLAALWALLGFLFTATSPGLSLLSSSGLKVNGSLGVFVCHVLGAVKADASAPDSSVPEREDCCLVCQTAQMASGTVAPQHFTLPTGTALHLVEPIAAQSWFDLRIAAAHPPRAPPAA